MFSQTFCFEHTLSWFIIFAIIFVLNDLLNIVIKLTDSFLQKAELTIIEHQRFFEMVIPKIWKKFDKRRLGMTCK